MFQNGCLGFGFLKGIKRNDIFILFGLPWLWNNQIFWAITTLSMKMSCLYMPCAVPVGLVNSGYCAMATCKQRAVKCELDLCQVYEIMVNLKHLLFSFHQINCLNTSVVIQARSQLYACKFYLKSSNCKCLKILSICIHTNCILQPFLTLSQVKFHKTLNFLPWKHDILYTEVDYPFLMMYELIRNIKVLSVTHRLFWYMYDLFIKVGEIMLASMLCFSKSLS